MDRLRFALATALLVGSISGCGQDQPNPPAQPSDLTSDFAQKTADQMKAANTGMDPKQARPAGRSSKK